MAMQTCTIRFSDTSVELQAGSESNDDELDGEEKDDEEAEDEDEDEEDQRPSKKTKVDYPAPSCQTFLHYCQSVCITE